MKIVNADPIHNEELDPEIEAALRGSKTNTAFKNYQERLAYDEGLLLAWKSDKSRVTAFKKAGYSLLDPKNKICLEVFCSYIPEQGVLKNESSYLGLSYQEESSLRIYPFVKDLETGKIYTVSDYLTDFGKNLGLDAWEESVEKDPDFKNKVPRPKSVVTRIDAEWDQFRFRLHKINERRSPAEHYTFVVNRAVLQCALLSKQELKDALNNTSSTANF